MKKFLALVVTVLLCCLVSATCFAASTPAVQVYYTYAHKNSVGGVEPTIGWRNTSGKTIKYVDWYLTAYNRVGDIARCDITGKSTIIAESIGPIDPYTPIENHIVTGYYFGSRDVYGVVDRQGNDSYFVRYDLEFYTPQESLESSHLLTDDEVQNAVYDHRSEFDPCWYNYSISDFKVSKAVVTFMDGSKTTISGDRIYSPYYSHILTNPSYGQLLKQYSAVFNPKDYVIYNPDVANELDSGFSSCSLLLMNHFINFGMKEGRQGSSEFNLAAYKANNPDLVALFGDDNVKYYEHYIASGKAEGRNATQNPYESARNFLAAS